MTPLRGLIYAAVIIVSFTMLWLSGILPWLIAKALGWS